jgi:hypothetical protein
MTARPKRLIWPENKEDCIFADTSWHETKVSLKTRELDGALIVAQLARRPRTNMNAALWRPIKAGELDPHHRLAMSAVTCIRLSFGRSGVERGAVGL